MRCAMSAPQAPFRSEVANLAAFCEIFVLLIFGKHGGGLCACAPGMFQNSKTQVLPGVPVQIEVYTFFLVS